MTTIPSDGLLDGGEEYTDEEMILIRLKEDNPGAVIIPPGLVKAIDGKTYYNEMFIIAK